MLEAAHGREHPAVAEAMLGVGSSHAARGNHRQALATYRDSLAISEKALDADHPDQGYALTGIGEAQLELGQIREAIQTLERAVSVREKNPGDRLWESQFALARAIANTDPERAGELATAARKGAEAGFDTDTVEKIDAWSKAR